MRLFSRRNRVWLVMLGLAIFSWIAHSTYRSLSRQRGESPTPASNGLLVEGMTVPAELELNNLSGTKSNLGDLRGKVVLINFWAGWCAPCLHEMPGLYDLQRRLENRGFVVLGMNMDDDSQGGMRVLRRVVKSEAPFSIYRGTDSALADRLSIVGLPFTIVLDRELKIRYSRAGEVNWSGAEAVKMIEGLL